MKGVGPRNIRFGLIGAGYLGRFRAERLSNLDRAELVAIADRDASRVAEIGKRLNVPFYTDYRKVLDVVEAVVISTPCDLHFEIGLESIKRGIHTLIEKPLCKTVEEGRILVDEAEKRGVILQVGFLERFNPSFIRALPFINDPSFIEIHRIGPFKERGLDVDVILDLMIHDIDIILSIVDSPVERIDAKGVPVLSNNVDIANVRLLFCNGCVANITASRISFSTQRKIRFFQKDRYISIDTKENKSKIYERRWDEKSRKYRIVEILDEEKLDHEDFNSSDPIRKELDAFIGSIIQGFPVERTVSGREALSSLAIAVQISKTIKENL